MFNYALSVFEVQCAAFFAAVCLAMGLFSLWARRNRGLAAVVGATAKEEETHEVVQVEDVKKKRVGYLTRMRRNAEAAGVKVTEGELLVMTMVVMVVAFLAGYVVSRSLYTSIPLMIVGLFAPRMVINRRKNKRMNIIERQMIEIMPKIASVMDAGRTPPQAFAIVSKDVPAPLGDELRILNQEVSLGTPVEQAVLNMAERLQNKDIRFMSQATSITQQAGGDLGIIYRNVAMEIRQRRSFREKVKSMSTQQRYSGYIISGLTPFVVAIMQLIDPSYLANFFNSALGLVALIYTVISIGIGIFLIRRMMSVED